MIRTNVVLDAKGLTCPMPIVKTKKAMNDLEPGQVIEVQATDKGSLADIQAWAKSTGHQYLGTREDGDVLRHYLRKANSAEMKEERSFPHIVQNEELQKRIESGDKVTIVDVREPAEYAFKRIPGAVSMPLGELENRLKELKIDDEIHVVCRTGNRSDMAAQQLSEKGFKNVKNVLPGMSEWTGPTKEE